ncbi:hypothetical protein ScPMuIL_005473 [Solemya velum]
MSFGSEELDLDLDLSTAESSYINEESPIQSWMKRTQFTMPARHPLPLRIHIKDLNPYITCGICKGYLYEASTITDCMHSFCKNCIVKHTELSVKCPICDSIIHPTDPLIQVKLDRTLQDIVYKLLPQVAEEEKSRRKKFNDEHGIVEQEIIQSPVLSPVKKRSPSKVPDSPKKNRPNAFHHSLVSILLECVGISENIDAEHLARKYVRVPGSATIANVATFIRRKHQFQCPIKVDLLCAEYSYSKPVARNVTLHSIQQQYYDGQDCLMLLLYRLRAV